MKNHKQSEVKNDVITPEDHVPVGDLVLFNRWLESIGITAATAWRWRRDGLISTVNISGRVYVSRNEIARFEKCAGRGDFRAIHVVPPPRGAQSQPEPCKDGVDL